ncbi:MAG: hypothetical protein FWG89_05215 [Treponema sp.]|nr:hypothetical protein [Treponema sp.]
MKICLNYRSGQVLILLILLTVFSACIARRDDTPIVPPLTSPLSQVYIGYGVINISFTRVNSEPDESSASQGYLRQGSVIKIHERRLVRNSGETDSWVFVEGIAEGNVQGWLRETQVDVYDNEQQALTASSSMPNR